MKSINFKHAILAGFLGTILFDLLGFALTGEWWDIASTLAEKTGLGMIYGVVSHFGNGILLALLYAGFSRSIMGPHWLRPFLFITVQTIVLVWLFMFPLLGAGIAGSNVGPEMAIGSLLRHWVYVVPFIFLINPKELEVPSTRAEKI